MSLFEPRCLVCGAPLGKGAPFEKTVRKSEVCSDKCYEIYTTDEDNQSFQPTQEQRG
jgi:predicted nucleic acid-binding Zn ribbon protein